MYREQIDYKELFQSFPSSFLVLDPEFKILEATNQFFKDSMTTRVDIIGKNLFVVFPDNPDDLNATGVANLKHSLNEVLRTKLPHSMPVQKYDIKNNELDIFEERYWSPVNVPLTDGDNQIKYIIHKVEDVTAHIVSQQKENKDKIENKELKVKNKKISGEILLHTQELETANRVLRKINDDLLLKSTELKRSNDELASFATTASHDIQAPFRIVGSFLNIIEENITDAAQIKLLKPYFAKIYNARERISSLLDDLLQFAMVSGDDKEMEEVDLANVWQDVLTNLESQIKDKEAIVELKGELPVLKCEPSQLMQLFQNLVGNAIKFTITKPMVVVTVTPQEEEYLFTISDNGVGIEPEYYERIFEVFQRLNTQNEFPGSGLGLAICKRIVLHHGGKIWVKSKKGEGSTFYFTLLKAQS